MAGRRPKPQQDLRFTRKQLREPTFPRETYYVHDLHRLRGAIGPSHASHVNQIESSASRDRETISRLPRSVFEQVAQNGTRLIHHEQDLGNAIHVSTLENRQLFRAIVIIFHDTYQMAHPLQMAAVAKISLRLVELRDSAEMRNLMTKCQRDLVSFIALCFPLTLVNTLFAP